MTSERYPTGTPEERESAIEAAALTIQRGELLVLPTDTVYGIAADAFDADAVQRLLEAKGRGRDMPPPVLVSSATTLDALAVDVPTWARALVEEFWPGPLTLVCQQQTSLQWDLGDTRGTVAVRMPDHELTREILDRTGPLAVSSANTTGRPAATDADAAERMLGEEVQAIVDDGESPGGEASTIIDATSEKGRVLRRGALSLDRLNEVLSAHDVVLTDDASPAAPAPAPEPVAASGAAATKTAAKKTTAKKTTATKTTATKTAAKKTATKKTAAKKTAAKKATAKKTTTTKTTAKKTAAKKTAATQTTPEPPQPGLFDDGADAPIHDTGSDTRSDTSDTGTGGDAS